VPDLFRAGKSAPCRELSTVAISPMNARAYVGTVSEIGEPEYLTPPARADGPVLLAEPDPAWADCYIRQKQRIGAALGPRALEVHHVGSTSVPGLAAKPVIDIVLVVADSSDESAYVPALQAAGYRLKLREPAWHQHRLLIDHEPDVQVHVFSPDSSEVQRMLRFRDRLRSHADDRDLYMRTKRELAARRWGYVQDYADAKSSVVEAILARATVNQHC
jgi:GrpB-like predicted nucleotidyltransferase (UPF0157 family)